MIKATVTQVTARIRDRTYLNDLREYLSCWSHINKYIQQLFLIFLHIKDALIILTV
jgi:hypothetical protein